MTTSSARPEALRRYAARVRAIARDVDDAVATVSRNAAICADRSPGVTGLGAAPLLASRLVVQANVLAGAVSRVAGAFEAADHGPAPGGIRRGDDVALARRLSAISPGLMTGILRAPLDHERGRRLGRHLRSAMPADAARTLDRLGVDQLDPEVASGILSGLGSAGLARLVDRAEGEARTRLGPSIRDDLVRRLGHVLRAAATTVAPLGRPGDPAVVSAGGLDLRLVVRLGRTRPGRQALRAIAPHVTTLPGPVAVSLAEALLLGPTRLDDFLSSAPVPPPATGDDASGEVAALRLLAAHPAAAYDLEARHRSGVSPTLTILDRAQTASEVDGAAAVIDAILNTSVDRGWARTWHRPFTGEVAAVEATPVDRVLSGLVAASIRSDRRRPATSALSRTLGRTVSHHLDFFTENLDQHRDTNQSADIGVVGPLTSTGRFFQVVSRDLRALDAVAATVIRPDRTGIATLLADHPPGRLTASDVHEVLTRETPLVTELRSGADAAGRSDRFAVLLSIHLGQMALSKAAGVAGKAGGPWGKAAATGAKLPLPVAARAAENQWGHTDDDREDAVRHASPYRAAVVAAAAMAADPDWRRALRPTATTSLDDLATLKPALRADQDRFDAWLHAQDPVVAEALTPLFR
ncbi:MAG: hypothetical protein ACR2MB_08695 [Acidimicrobiales bacterium]